MTNNETRKIRRLSDLSLIDDYLFGLFIQEAGSEEILKGLIECMLDVKINHVRLKQPQHSISNEPNLHGVRLDAFLEDDENTLYNIEVQVANKGNIPKRMRYNQSLIDKEQMPSGEYDYDKLSRTIIVFVCDFDLFDKGLYRYTFKNICMEDTSLELGDKTIKVVLNTKGKDSSGVKPELVDLLKYFHSSTANTVNNSSSEFIKKLDKMLEPIKNSPKFGGDFMSLEEKIYNEKKESWLGGRQEGRQEGRIEGRQEGRQEEKQRTIEKLRKMGMTEEQINAFYS